MSAKPPLAAIDTLTSFQNEKIITSTKETRQEGSVLKSIVFPTTPIELQSPRKGPKKLLKKFTTDSLLSTPSSKYSTMLKHNIRASFSKEGLEMKASESKTNKPKINIRIRKNVVNIFIASGSNLHDTFMRYQSKRGMKRNIKDDGPIYDTVSSVSDNIFNELLYPT